MISTLVADGRPWSLMYVLIIFAYSGPSTPHSISFDGFKVWRRLMIPVLIALAPGNE